MHLLLFNVPNKIYVVEKYLCLNAHLYLFWDLMALFIVISWCLCETLQAVAAELSMKLESEVKFTDGQAGNYSAWVAFCTQMLSNVNTRNPYPKVFQLNCRESDDKSFHFSVPVECHLYKSIAHLQSLLPLSGRWT